MLHPLTTDRADTLAYTRLCRECFRARAGTHHSVIHIAGNDMLDAFFVLSTLGADVLIIIAAIIVNTLTIAFALARTRIIIALERLRLLRAWRRRCRFRRRGIHQVGGRNIHNLGTRLR